MEDHYRKRIEELSNQACDYLEEIPTDITHEEVMANEVYKHYFLLYDECTNYINAIKAELSYGKVIPID